MKNNDNAPNIALSGWSGVGTTSLSLLLAFMLERRYYNIGDVFRALGKKLGYTNEGDDRVKFDEYIEPIIGKTIDKFVDFKILNDSGILLESDIGAYRIGKHPKVFSIFLKGGLSSRINKVVAEGRQQAEDTLIKREKVLKQLYSELWELDIYDEELIEKKYNLVFDNSDLGLYEELVLVFDTLQEIPGFKEMHDWDKLHKTAKKEVDMFTAKGKDNLRIRMGRKKLIVSADKIMREIVKQFPEDVENYPKEIQNVLLGQR